MFWISKLYFYIQYFFHNYLHINIPGFRIACSLVNKDRIVYFGDTKIYLNKNISYAYGRIISGLPNEPETHVFLKRVINSLEDKLIFINAGAAIGEFSLSIANNSKVSHVYAFEPNTKECEALTISAKINELSNITIINKALNDKPGEVIFYLNEKAPYTSSILKELSEQASIPVNIQATTIDIEFASLKHPSIMLFDAEGAEKNIIDGGKRIISESQPLIIVEFNSINKEKFSLNDLLNIIGTDYTFYRLRNDGYIDNNLDDVWNVIAVNKKSVFSDVLQKLIR